MAYLKQFATLKVNDAMNAAKTDAVAILGIDQFVKIAKETASGKAKDVVKNRFPKLFKMASGANDAKSKYEAVKNACNSLKKPDWTGDLGQQVIKDISNYHEKVNALIAAVEALVD